MAERTQSQTIRRALIFSADVGSGHLVAARTLASDLERRGVEVVLVEDLGTSLGRTGRLVIRAGSRLLFDHAPWLYDLYYRTLLHVPLARAVTIASLRRAGSRRLLRLIRRHEPDVVVSTYPGITVVLGELRRRRRLAIPVLAVITDLAGLFFWAHRGVDMHLLAWRESEPEVARVSRANNITYVQAPTDPAFLRPVERAVARARLGIDSGDAVALVSGGGWGVGDLARTVTAALAAGPDVVIVLAGGNARLHRELAQRFGDEPRVRVLGFTTEMSDLLAAADVLVHATAGVTCLEAALRDCPVIVYGFSVGHIRHNADVMSRLGLVELARDAEELSQRLRDTLNLEPVPATTSAAAPPPTAAEVVTTARPRARPLPRWRIVASRLVPSATLLSALLLSTTSGYALASRGLHVFEPLHHVHARAREAAIIVRCPPAHAQLIVQELQRSHLAVTIAVTRPPARATLAAARRTKLEIIPALGGGQPLAWVNAPARLHALRHNGRPTRSLPYVVPAHGFTLGEYLLADIDHGVPISPEAPSSTAIAPGSIVEAESWPQLQALAHRFRARGIRLVAVRTLLAHARR